MGSHPSVLGALNQHMGTAARITGRQAFYRSLEPPYEVQVMCAMRPSSSGVYYVVQLGEVSLLLHQLVADPST